METSTASLPSAVTRIHSGTDECCDRRHVAQADDADGAVRDHGLADVVGRLQRGVGSAPAAACSGPRSCPTPRSRWWRPAPWTTSSSVSPAPAGGRGRPPRGTPRPARRSRRPARRRRCRPAAARSGSRPGCAASPSETVFEVRLYAMIGNTVGIHASRADLRAGRQLRHDLRGRGVDLQRGRGHVGAPGEAHRDLGRAAAGGRAHVCSRRARCGSPAPSAG